MKKIIQKLLILIIGITIGGGISVLASNYILKASDIKYNESKTVQQAVEELYSKADKIKGSNEVLPVGNPIIAGYKITIPYTGSYQNIKCVYGTSESYGQEGTIENNTCSFKGTNSDQKLYYKIVATNITNNIEGKIYEYSGSNITGTCDNFDDDKNCITKTTYQTGDAITLGGYKWHVIGDEGTKLTLLMDANQLGSNSTMGHCGSSNSSSNNCTSNGQYYVYSWDKSKIRTYLNGTFLTDLESKINNDIVTTPICADPSRGYSETTYGGYLMSELAALGKTSSCANQVSDKVRLITESEYWNMSPKFSGTNSSYPNTHNITRLTTSSDYATWLYCNSTTCGDSDGYWWTMDAILSSSADSVKYASLVNSDGGLGISYGQYAYGLRLVITIIK